MSEPTTPVPLGSENRPSSTPLPKMTLREFFNILFHGPVRHTTPVPLRTKSPEPK